MTYFETLIIILVERYSYPLSPSLSLYPSTLSLSLYPSTPSLSLYLSIPSLSLYSSPFSFSLSFYPLSFSIFCLPLSSGRRKKSYFFSSSATKRGKGARAWPLRKFFFFEALKKIPKKSLQKMWPLSSKGHYLFNFFAASKSKEVIIWSSK